MLGVARPLAEVCFISDAEAVSAVANTPVPRPHSAAEKLTVLKGIHERINASDVPQNRQVDYVWLLSEFEDTFSADSNEIGLTDITQHNIKLLQGPNDPTFKGQFRLAIEHLQLIKDNFVGCLCSGLVERSNLKFNAPVFCVLKPPHRG